MKKSIFCMCIFFFCFILIGCSGTQKVSGNPNINVNDIVINKSHAYLNVGEKTVLLAQVFPFNADNQKIKWKSDNDNIAVVNGGIVVGTGEGRTVITCESEDGNFTDNCIVFVSTPKLNYNKYPNNLASTNFNNEYFIENLSKESNFINDSVNDLFNKIYEINSNLFNTFQELENRFYYEINNIKNFYENLKIESVEDNGLEENLINENVVNYDNEKPKSIVYGYHYYYNSEGVDNEDEENIIYKDDKTIIKEFII